MICRTEKRAFAIHELAVTDEIFNIVLQHAQDNKAKRVVSIHLRVGEMLGLTEEWIQWYFDHLSQGTIAEGGKIIFTKSPIIFQCESCRHTMSTEVSNNDTMCCPSCGNSKMVMLNGREFFIESIGVIH